MEQRLLLSTTYYVSPTGSDLAAGDSDTAAFATLQHAADIVQAGDMVIVRPGTYRGMNLFGAQGGTADQPIQFMADPGAVITHVSNQGINADLAEINIESTGGWFVIRGFRIDADGSEQRAGIRVADSPNCQILSNTINHAYIGIFASGSSGTIIRDNICSNATDQHGIYMSGDQNYVVAGNTLFANAWDGLHLNVLVGAPNSTNTAGLIEDNIIYANTLSGIDMEGVTNSVFRNNIIYGNVKHGITVHNLDQANTPPCVGNVFVDNTMVGNGMFGIQMAAGGNTANTLYDNIFLQTGSLSYGSIGVSGAPTGLLSDYNVVVNSFSTDLGFSSMPLSAWQVQTGQDAHSIVGTAAQLFEKAADIPPDYHLILGSPAIDTGIASLGGTSAPMIDIEGDPRPQGGGYDIGAYEFPEPTTVPVAPSDLRAVPMDPLSIKLSWTDNSDNESGFLIERSTDGVSFTQVAMVAKNVTSYTDSGLMTGVNYLYRVRATNFAGNSAYSGVASAVGPSAPAAPAAPSNVTAAGAAYGQINLSWVDNSTNETALLIERSVDGTQFTQIAAAVGSATSFLDSGLHPNVTYFYRIRATNFGSNSAYSGTTSATTAPVGEGPFSIWVASDAPTNSEDSDTSATEVGVKFRSDVGGYITAVRFYKGSENIGIHTAHLWTETGTMLANATFTDETDSGWQTVILSTPVSIAANTVYVASYFTPGGHYADDAGYFSTSGIDSGPLHALADGVDGPNGVYVYSSSGGFPTVGWEASNYYVDVVFQPLPSVTAAVYSYATLAHSLTFTTNEPVTAGIFSLEVRNLTTGAEPTPTGYTFSNNRATFTFGGPLPSGNYQATLLASGVTDAAGQHPAADYTYNFFFLTGDIDRDRTVGFSDLVILARHYGQPGTYAQGDLNGDGKVDFTDLVLLARNYGHKLPPVQIGPPTLATRATPQTNPVTGTSVALSVLGADDGGEGNLSYTWSLTGTPPAPVSFSVNGTNAAKNTVATFTQAGTYNFLVTLTDSGGLSATSSVSVTVNQTLTGITVAPGSASVNQSATQQFSATAYDQFGSTLASQPTLTWTISSGGVGSIDGSGLYTAPGSAGAATVNATAGSITGSASVTVNGAPTVATPATASPDPVTGTTASLSVLGDDDGGEANLTYTWSTTGTPPAPVTFSVNGSNAAKNTTATFTQAGTYSFLVTITDSGGLSVTSPVSLTVNQTLTRISVSPGSAMLNENGTEPFSATAYDQFGVAMAAQPAFTWSLKDGAGSVDSSGVYTAPASAATATVQAASGTVVGTASVTVSNAAPTLATPAAAQTNPVTGTSAALSVLGADDGGESNLTYTWSLSGTPPAPVSFSVNGTNAAKNTVATFTQAGTYSFVVTIADSEGLSTSSAVTVTVSQTLSGITVSPAMASPNVNGTQQFSATAVDQFGNAMASQPAFTWSIGSGGGSVDDSGLYTAPASPGDATVIATSGPISGSTSVTVSAAATPMSRQG